MNEEVKQWCGAVTSWLLFGVFALDAQCCVGLMSKQCFYCSGDAVDGVGKRMMMLQMCAADALKSGRPDNS